MDPDEMRDAGEGKIKVIKKIDGKIIKVVYYRYMFGSKKGKYFIITAYYV